MPRNTQLKFPSREQRRKLIEELQKLGKDPQLAANESFQQYAAAMKVLDEKMDKLSAVGEDGLPKNLTAEDADDLSKTIVDTANLGENFIASAIHAGGKADAGVPGMVNRLQGMLAKDFDALQNYDPQAKPQSLPELQESRRTRTIDLRGRKLGSMQNMQNARIPMTVVNSRGEKRRGVFTKATHFRAKTEYQQFLDKAKGFCKDPKQKAELDKFLDGARKRFKGIALPDGTLVTDKTPDTVMIGVISDAMWSRYGTRKLSAGDMRTELSNAGLDTAGIPDKALKTLADGFTKMKSDVGLSINATGLKLEDGSRLDNRNSAMSSVATLLGVSKLIARSENMKYIGEDGKVIEGTFMDFAKGVDLYKKPQLFKHVAQIPYGDDANKGKFIKQIADLQVLDYICMNRDRHHGNILYDIDQEGNIRGIQGIDNDSSFATGRDTASIEDLRIISKSMADKVKNLTPEMLKFSLRGHGLSEKELNAAGARLADLQGALKIKKVRVVADDKLGKENIIDLYPKDANRKNMFSLTNRFLTVEGNQFRDYDHPFQPLPEQSEADLKEVYTTDRRGTVGGLTDSLRQVGRKVSDEETGFNVDNLTSKLRGSSPEYKAMVAAAKEAKALLKEMTEKGQLDESKMATDPEALEALQKTVKAFQKLDETTDSYLQYKMADRKVSGLSALTGKNAYEQKHIDYAKDLKKISDEFNKSFSRPATEEEQADRDANLQRTELDRIRNANTEQKAQVLGM